MLLSWSKIVFCVCKLGTQRTSNNPADTLQLIYEADSRGVWKQRSPFIISCGCLVPTSDMQPSFFLLPSPLGDLRLVHESIIGWQSHTCCLAEKSSWITSSKATLLLVLSPLPMIYCLILHITVTPHFTPHCNIYHPIYHYASHSSATPEIGYS